MKCSLILSAALALTLVACGASEPGPVADAEKTPAQVEEQVAQADTATLEQTLADYKAAIAEKKSELKGLQDDLGSQFEKTAGDVVDLLGGDTAKQEEIGSDYEAMKERIAGLEDDLDGLKTRMKIYADELAKR